MSWRIRAFFGVLGLLIVLPPEVFAQSAGQSAKAKAQSNSPVAPAASGAPASLSHDLSGVWMQYPDGLVPGLPGMNAIDQRFRPPLTTYGQARFDASRPLVGPRAVPGQENSPTLNCDPDGPPRVLNLPNPFEIVQISGRVFMFFEEQHVWRTIWADGRALPKDPEPSWLGYSVGRWEGDTFVVETAGFNDKQWVDGFGNPRSDKTHLIERYRRLNHDTLELQIIIDDPKSYLGVWTNPPKLHKLETSWEIGEWFCVADEDRAYDDVIRLPAGGAAPSHK